MIPPGPARGPAGGAAPLRVIGVDPGTRRTGFGVVERQAGRMVHVAHGVIAPPPAWDIGDRLVYIHEHLREAIAAHGPDEAALERVFSSRNAASALKLGHARGVALLALRQAGLPVAELAASEIKQGVTGSGRAGKDQVGAMVKALLGLPEAAPEDAADALAAALCRCQAAAFDRAAGAAWAQLKAGRRPR